MRQLIMVVMEGNSSLSDPIPCLSSLDGGSSLDIWFEVYASFGILGIPIAYALWRRYLRRMTNVTEEV